MNYSVILFKNNKKKKILKSFITEKKALEFYEKKLKESSKVNFNVGIENGVECEFKIGIISKKPLSEQIFYIDEFGRNIIINPKIEDNKYIIKINDFNIEEEIYDLNTNKKICMSNLIKNYLGNKNFYMISKINNKFVIQNDLEIKLFSCKTDTDCERFLETLQIVSDNKNFMIVFDVSSPQKKYLYETLSNFGFDKKMLYRKSTTYPKQK